MEEPDGGKDRSRIVLVVVLVLVIAFLRACFEDEDENEDEISWKVLAPYFQPLASGFRAPLPDFFSLKSRAVIRKKW